MRTGGRRSRLGSLSSFGCALGVVARSLGLLGCTLGVSGVAVFIGVRPRGRWVHPSARYIGVRLSDCRVHPGPIGAGSLGCALGVVEFIRGHWRASSCVTGFIGVRTGSSGVAQFIGVYLGVVGFVRGRWVHWGAQWGLSGPFGVAGFIGPSVVGFVRGALSGFSLISFECALRVVGRVLGHCGAYWGSPGSSCVAGFVGVRSMGLIGSVLEVVVLVRGRWVLCGTPWRSTGWSWVHFGLVGFVRGR